MDEDEQDNMDEAFKMYTEAAELCLKLVRLLSVTIPSVNAYSTTGIMVHHFFYRLSI